MTEDTNMCWTELYYFLSNYSIFKRKYHKKAIKILLDKYEKEFEKSNKLIYKLEEKKDEINKLEDEIKELKKDKDELIERINLLCENSEINRDAFAEIISLIQSLPDKYK